MSDPIEPEGCADGRHPRRRADRVDHRARVVGGVVMGRPRKLSPAQVAELVRRIDLRRTLSNKALSRDFGVSENTLVSTYQRAKGWTRRRDANADAGN